MSSPITPAEDVIMRKDGRFIMANVIPLIAEGMLWGAYIPLVIFVVCSLCSKGLRTERSRMYMLLVTLAMFTLSTSLLSLDTYKFFFQVKRVFLQRTEEGETRSQKTSSVLPSFNGAALAGITLFPIEFLIGDAVVIWRTWMLWQDNPRAMVIPLFFWLSSFALTLGSLGSISLADVRAGIDFEPTWGATYTLGLVSNICSLLANGSSTTMTAIKAWQHRKVIKESLGASTPATRVQRIMALLVESGFVYFIVFGIQMVSYGETRYSILQILRNTWANLGNQILGLYPTTIIVLVDLQRTFWDAPELSLHISSMSFASAVPGFKGSEEKGGTRRRTSASSTYSSSSNPHEV